MAAQSSSGCCCSVSTPLACGPLQLDHVRGALFCAIGTGTCVPMLHVPRERGSVGSSIPPTHRIVPRASIRLEMAGEWQYSASTVQATHSIGQPRTVHAIRRRHIYCCFYMHYTLAACMVCGQRRILYMNTSPVIHACHYCARYCNVAALVLTYTVNTVTPHAS